MVATLLDGNAGATPRTTAQQVDGENDVQLGTANNGAGWRTPHAHSRWICLTNVTGAQWLEIQQFVPHGSYWREHDVVLVPGTAELHRPAGCTGHCGRCAACPQNEGGAQQRLPPLR
eukprot:COSAG01_NODE_23457_length_814_cov_2.386014_2_plen_116_part_01